MCGIAGYVAGPHPQAFARFQADVLRTLAHRGPDDSGWLTESQAGVDAPPATPGRWGLFHRRLSILDLSPLGHQPMVSPDGRLALAFNGEIYNFLEIRSELEVLGWTFRSHSDTEVLLAALGQWGLAALPRLIGMFAFALVDRPRGKLLLVRDFFGIKPLYYAPVAGGLAFASELKALRPLISGRVRPDRLFIYLRDGLIDHGGETLFADVMQVPAAHYLEVDLATGAVGHPQRYWDIRLDAALPLSFEEAAGRLRDLFLESVRLHLRSDVPVGAALSGGIDSSAIVCAMRVLHPQSEIHTFTFAAGDAAIDEERFADVAADRARTVPHKIRIAPGDLVSDLDELIRVQDEPFGSTSIYAQYRVFRLAAETGIKVMLDGQGADEMLAGYHGYYDARVGSLLGRGAWWRAYQFAGRAAQRPGVGGRASLLARGIRRFLPAGLQARGKALAGRPLIPSWLSASWFAGRGVVPAAEGRTQKRREQLREKLYATLTRTSLPMLLRYEDRNSMAWSIESRVPFLTPALAQFLLNLPEEYLINAAGETKCVFRAAMRGIVPDPILDRRDKIGFATPERRWLGDLRPWLAAILSPDRLRRVPALNADVVAREWKAVLDGRRRFDWRIWRWVNVVRWAEIMDACFD